MLDSDTKRRIDTARDTLVGKVPDPKSQVEQITIALIYKFMDDMDADAEELGGQRKFFTGDYARYGWAKLMRSGLGGFETLNLYAEAIGKMPENPGIPSLFRDIFKNAYLPYRDPETLKGFLKIIDEFTYDHSERLGDAFEYLLSVLGSQGDAGQFRTPRHIIDLIVKLIDPKKDETILDPACGTAGFLISSYKHILTSNVDGQGHSTLTPDERGRLAQNFKGYDISPDMVRLSLVNLYLHGFTNPHIDEYDTLTSDDKWNEYADVILANPPFMSPKGGIKPHNRFSVQSKRSEVLFVDYIAEHLTPSGRAGIIVPQGVLTEKTQALKKLRSLLINQCGLNAIITLPAGCFRPYADAETAVLIFDKRSQSKTVWFYELSHDGFTPDDRRTPTKENDIPDILSRWPEREDSQKSFSVSLEQIRASGETLSVGAFKKDGMAVDHNKLLPGWKIMNLDSLVEEINLRAGQSHNYPVLSVTKHNGFVHSSTYFKKKVFSDNTADYKVVLPGQFAYSTIHLDEGSIGFLIGEEPGVISPMYKVFRMKVGSEIIDPVFLYRILKSEILIEKYKTLGNGSVKRRKSISFEKFAAISIPVPPSSVQREVIEQSDEILKLEQTLSAARDRLLNEVENILHVVRITQDTAAS
ncbi:MAG: restriction endonuclease subunit M/S [Mesorhizobium sp.]|uniref:N-6 DNA methylase n=1 Tax=Mesorhizobium sp. TaxID=1871066 RepID=UPI000FE524ED|nr:N-6 DNA methylase [Mesorhizobium sp.]RWP02989.1 MAG: restriction endonuclease subunit M/S [Mesorhizobium sp.]